MKNIQVIDHPFIKRDISILRDRRTSSEDFRIVLKRLASLMVFEVTKDLRVSSHPIETPLEKTEGFIEQIVIHACPHIAHHDIIGISL